MRGGVGREGEGGGGSDLTAADRKPMRSWCFEAFVVGFEVGLGEVFEASEEFGDFFGGVGAEEDNGWFAGEGVDLAELLEELVAKGEGELFGVGFADVVADFALKAGGALADAGGIGVGGEGLTHDEFGDLFVAEFYEEVVAVGGVGGDGLAYFNFGVF